MCWATGQSRLLAPADKCRSVVVLLLRHGGSAGSVAPSVIAITLQEKFAGYNI